MVAQDARVLKGRAADFVAFARKTGRIAGAGRQMRGKGMAGAQDKVEVENVNVPGHVVRVNRGKYEAMKAALLPVLPDAAPGITVAEAQAALLGALDPVLFPGGRTSGWWLKTVQLDLEAKGVVARAPTKPMRIFRLR